ncbi:uncharacterized protein LOC100694122 [Oreochromis niloticus]|uniref:uncharacterized protein LOC100694122 n=1 Tax=Oreochromis niloticus TaxID=8128 RepID=UPI000905CA50|nr:uncharacterized protein LOC100694122 [Oreochromis niloticus]
MAAASALVSEDSLLCPVCLSVFTKPVSIPCGHNFCLDCITDYWSTLSVLQCPLCKEMFYTRPLLRVNPVIDEMAEKVKKSVQEMLLSSAEEAGNEDVLCDYCTGSKVSAQKSCLMCLVSYCQKHLEPHQRISALKKHKLIDPVKDLENRVCQDHGEPLELICRLDQMFLCQSCKCSDHKTHETVILEDEAEMRKTQLRSENNSMDQMIQEREQKIQEVQQSVKTSRSKAEDALLYSRKVMTALVEHIKTEFTRLSEASEMKQKINETEAESFINELEAEITHIKKKKLQFHEALLIRDPFRFLENVLPLTYNKPQLKDWSAVTVTSDQFMIQETMAELETKVREEVSTLCNINFRGGKQQRTSNVSKYKDIISRSDLISSGPPAVYQLRAKKQKFGTRMTVGEKKQDKINRTILLMGETGAGKSTLINALLNYTMGVKWEDGVWFTIVEEKKKSQTSDVIVYEIFGFEDKTLPYSLTIIDTPGYGDTRGIEHGGIFSHRLLNLLDGVHEVHAVGLVMKATENRLSDRLMYVFDSVMSLLGKDVEQNIIALITHSDGSKPKNAFKALEDAKIKCAKNKKNQSVYFLFNNCQLEDEAEKYLKLNFESSERGVRGFTAFLKETTPLQPEVTPEVLKERIRLTACIQNLQERIRFTEVKQREMKQTREALQKNEVVTPCVVFKHKEPIRAETCGVGVKAAVSCTVCEENCHYSGCTVSLNHCEVFRDGLCTSCTNKCPASEHVKEKWRYVTRIRRGQKNKTRTKKKDVHFLEKEMNKLTAEKSQFLDESYQHVVRLEEIALKADSVSTIVHLDFLIEKMKEKGDAEKIKKLEEMRRREDEGIRGALRISLISSPHEDIISHSFLIRSGPPAVYQLRLKKEEFGTLTRMTVGEKNPNKINRTILLVGETGAGKSTLINALVNYTMGVKWEDRVWFQIVEEEKKSQIGRQTESQTSDVIVYEIFGFEDKTLPYSLTIINSPGYGDTRASDYDDTISYRLLDLFQSDDGVHEVHAVGLVMKEMKVLTAEKEKWLSDSYHHAVRLEEIALKADSASTIVHLDFLIEMMKEKGDTDKVQKLEEMRREDGGTKEAQRYKLGQTPSASKNIGRPSLWYK